MTSRKVWLFLLASLALAGTLSAAPPTNLTATSVTGTTIDLTWSGSSPFGYRVRYRTGVFATGPDDTSATSVETAQTSLTLTNLSLSTTYYIAVYAQISNAVIWDPTPAHLVITTTHGPTAGYYVDSLAGSDGNAGTSAAPWKTITYALTVALSGDTVNVRRGIYNLTTGETFPIVLVTGVRLISTSGASVTTLDATGANRIVVGAIASASNTLFEGFTVKGALIDVGVRVIGPVGGAGVYCGFNCFAVFRRNIIIGNQVRAGDGTGYTVHGAGVFVDRGGPRIENNVIANNVVRGGSGQSSLTVAGTAGGDGLGGGIWVENGQDVQIVNNTIYGNVAFGGWGGDSPAGVTGGAGGNAFGGGVGGTGFHVFNNLIASNQTVPEPGGGPPATMGPAGVAHNGGLQSFCACNTINNNLFWRNQPDDAAVPGTPALIADPLFRSPATRDFHLSLLSPARGGGDPAGAPLNDLDNGRRPSPPSLGALERPWRDHVEFHGDFNGDRRDDLLIRHRATGDIGMWLMSGPAIIAGGFVGSVQPSLDIAGIADFNGDGQADILFRDPVSGDMGMWLMKGMNIIGGGYLGVVDPVVEIAGFGDFNGDGKADILFLQQTTGTVAMWFMNGPSIIGGGSTTTGDPLLFVAGIGDFNGDGKDDILWRHHATGDVAIWLMNGINITGGGLVGAANLQLSVAGVGDTNADGKADVIFRHTNGDVSIWLMNGTTIIGGGLAGNAPSALDIASVGDYNGDARADILLNFAETGDVGMWLMNGTFISSGAYVASTGAGYEVH